MSINSPLKRILPKSLLGRSLMIIVTPLVLLQIVSTVLFFETHWDKVSRRLASSVAGDVAVVIDIMRRDSSPENQIWLTRLARSSMGLELEFRNGEVLQSVTTSGNDNMERTLLEALEIFVRKPARIDAVSRDRHVIIEIQLSNGVLEVITQRKRLFSSTTYVFVLWMVGISLILFAVATIFMRNQVKPIRRLAIAADNFGKGRDVEVFKPEGAAEVRQAAQAFLAMKDRIQRQISQRTDMLAGVSHDLRTPLTRMKLQIALLEENEGAEDLRGDIEEMEYLLEEYLAFARGEGTEKQTDTDLNGLLRDVTNQVSRKGGAIDLHLEEQISLTIRPNAVKRCITNLIENGLKYADHVSVMAGRREDYVEIIIDDDGPGVPEDKREEVFKPFVRLEVSRNPGTGGVGLGLSIARDVVRGHGGDIILSDSPMGGLRATVRLPI